MIQIFGDDYYLSIIIGYVLSDWTFGLTPDGPRLLHYIFTYYRSINEWIKNIHWA